MNQCFWDGFEKNNYLFCEEQLCAFISEPANTWTNIGYLIVAIMILKQKDVINKRVKNLFFTASFCLFIGSSLFHMTSTLWGRLADVSTMFILSMTVLTLSVQRYSGLSEKRANLFFVIGLTLSLTFLFVMKFGHILFFSQLVAVTILEFRLGKTTKSLDMKGVKLAILFLIVAFTFWILDVAKILCHPGNHILTGHGVWHLLAGASFYVFFKSYKGRDIFKVE